MKKSLKIMAAVLAAGLSLTSLVGCKSKTSSPNSASDIEISFWVAGFGETFMDKIIDGFNAKYPEYHAYKTSGRNSTTLVNSLKLGKNDTTDIYFSATDVLINYHDMFMDLSDIAESKIDGEDKSIKDKYDASLYRSLKNPDGSLDTLGWAGAISGIMYNADIIDGKTYKVPKTTGQLQQLAIALSNDKKYNIQNFTPFVNFNDGGYYLYVVKAWMAQYAGIDYYMDSWLQLKDAEGKAPSKDVYLSENDGKKQALEVLTQIFKNEYVLYGSNSASKDSAQTKFIQGKAAMMFNGTWMYNEAQASGSKDKNFKIMRTPVISAIIDKCPSISEDSELAAVVDAVDNYLDNGGEMVLSCDDYDITEEEWNRILAARRYVYHNGSEHSLIVNKYTNAKEGVKKFIQYYYSDAGLAAFINTTHAAANASVTDDSIIDYTGWIDYEKELYSDSRKFTYITDGNARSPMFTKNVMKVYGTIPVVTEMSAAGNAKNAETIWAEFKADVEKNWSIWGKNAGYKDI